MLCGLPGSGKSTLALKLEAQHNALRLLPDEWIARLGLNERDIALRANIEAVQLDIAAKVLAQGGDVVLEAGFWYRHERDVGKALAAANGAEARLIYLDVPPDELKRRLVARNAALPANTFRVQPGELDEWIGAFEAPTADEGPEPPPL
jgi:predicted kinase